MRIFIVTLDEPVYAPVYVQKIIEKAGQQVVGITLLSAAGRRGWLGLAKQRLAMYGVRDFLRAAWLFGLYRALGMLPTRWLRRRPFSITRLARTRSIPVYPTDDVNSKHFVEQLRALDVDILISIAANQIFRRELLGIPRLACLNVHSSLLPQYRGIDGLFWALANGETRVGVTVHLMTERIDDGAIVCQEPMDVTASDTLHSLYYKAIELGSDLVARAIRLFEQDKVVTRSNDLSVGSYYSWPTREAAAQFRRHGRTFF
jgi:methionyl-tRNA formyltransferase